MKASGWSAKAEPFMRSKQGGGRGDGAHAGDAAESAAVAVGVIQLVGDGEQAVEELLAVEQLVEAGAAAGVVAAVQAAALEARGDVGVDIQVVEPVVRAAELLDDGQNLGVVERVAVDLVVQHGLHVPGLDGLGAGAQLLELRLLRRHGCWGQAGLGSPHIPRGGWRSR